MNTQDLQHFRELLLNQRKTITDAYESSRESARTVNLDQTSVGRLSRMDAMQSQAMAQESKRRQQLQLTRIDAALRRIEEEEYGYCAVCEEEIDIRRLEVDPANPFCVTCASRL